VAKLFTAAVLAVFLIGGNATLCAQNFITIAPHGSADGTLAGRIDASGRV